MVVGFVRGQSMIPFNVESLDEMGMFSFFDYIELEWLLSTFSG